jgi:hypothetical protein
MSFPRKRESSHSLLSGFRVKPGMTPEKKTRFFQRVFDNLPNTNPEAGQALDH